MRRELRQYIAGIRDALFLCADAGRSVTVFSDDVYVVSYPKSGNTWMRFLLANLLHPESPTTFQNVDIRIPEIYNYSDRALRSLSRPRILKSHEAFDFRYPKVIYIVRDPRDVAVSKYHWIRKWRGIPDGYPMEEFVSRWILAEFDRYLKAGSWADNVLSWLAMRGGALSFLLVRYEDVIGNTLGELRRIASFLGTDCTEASLSRAIELSSADRMRSLEKAESRHWHDTRQTRQDIPFVRKAGAGGWRTSCPPTAVARIEAAWWPLMRLLGYQLAEIHPDRLAKPLVQERVCESLATVDLFSKIAGSDQPEAEVKYKQSPGDGHGSKISNDYH